MLSLPMAGASQHPELYSFLPASRASTRRPAFSLRPEEPVYPLQGYPPTIGNVALDNQPFYSEMKTVLEFHFDSHSAWGCHSSITSR